MRCGQCDEYSRSSCERDASRSEDRQIHKYQGAGTIFYPLSLSFISVKWVLVAVLGHIWSQKSPLPAVHKRVAGFRIKIAAVPHNSQ